MAETFGLCAGSLLQKPTVWTNIWMTTHTMASWYRARLTPLLPLLLRLRHLRVVCAEGCSDACLRALEHKVARVVQGHSAVVTRELERCITVVVRWCSWILCKTAGLASATM